MMARFRAFLGENIMVKRIVIRRKKEKPKNDSKTVYNKTLGPEPIIRSVESESSSELIRAYTWFSQRYSTQQEREEARAWIADYMRAHPDLFDKKDVRDMATCNHKFIESSMFANARLLNSGAILPTSIVDRFHVKIKNVLEQKRAGRVRNDDDEESTEGDKPAVYQPSIQERTAEKTSELIGEVEGLIDDGEKFSVYELLQKKQIKAGLAKALGNKFRPVLRELKEAQKWEDDQLKEAYRSIGRAGLNKLVAMYSAIIDDCDRWANNQKATRAPRKEKEKSATVLVAKMRYLKQWPELKLVSIDPAHIIGAQALLAYNVKYKKAFHYVADSMKGLSVKGTTLQGWSKKGSSSKVLRKPEQTLKELLGSRNNKQSANVLEGLTTKAGDVNGRINEDVILLKVFT